MTTARAVLHVGLPKTGTSFLQGTMRANAELLAGHGVHLPEAEGERLFLAVLHLTDRSQTWGRSSERGQKHWASVVAEVRGRAATTVISSETLCLATDEQIARILDDLAGVDVDVVVTVRDPARQVPAEWQEGVKHGRRMGYDEFLDTVLAEPAPTAPGRRRTRERFWNAQDPARVLDRWAAQVGVEHVHVVTCPPPGAGRDLLWQRFASVLGCEAAPVDVPAEANTSLGEVQTEVLRRVNRRMTRKGNEKAYGDVVKRLYAGTILRGQAGEKVRLPDSHLAEVEQLADSWIAHIERRGHPVVGDLSDLQPQVTSAGGSQVTKRKLLESSLDATADLLREVERLRAELASLRSGRAALPLRGGRKQGGNVSTSGRR
ncbi:MAG: hypothetical protein M3237_02665 [Actinomycetota bacterium]|nr:hypothetical protein [Actinomycetota bacterium]